MSPWWTALVLALHLVPSGSTPDPFLVRVFSQNQVILEAQVQERVPGVFTLITEANLFPARIERSDLYGQVYTLFSPWDLVFPVETAEDESESIAAPENDLDTEELTGPQYAAGPLAPITIDLTPFLLQDSLRVPGRYSLSWELDIPAVDPIAKPIAEPSTTNLNLILEETNMNLFSPELGLMIQVNGI